MKPIALTLKGFRGIRKGLGRDTIELNFEQLTGETQLIAIAGKNGRGKTTIMDNMHPYPVMPSHAGADGLGGFSYYDHVFLPESVKDFIWEHEGKRYRSQLIFRLNGKKKTEAYLHVKNGEQWSPVVAHNGIVSDGKSDTYLRCVESILGNAETFFTSVFSAQGKRHLSKYKNSEIKTLLADLLGLDEIKVYGQKASETVKLLKTGLIVVRQELTGLRSEAENLKRQRTQWGNVQSKIESVTQQKLTAQETFNSANTQLAKLIALREVAMEVEGRRSQLIAEREALINAGRNAIASLDEQSRRENERLNQLDRRIADRKEAQNAKLCQLDQQRKDLAKTVTIAEKVNRAGRRLPILETVVTIREKRVAELAKQVQQYETLVNNRQLMCQRLESIEREAGQAALKAEELTRRFKLTSEVPCVGTELQRQCKLLGDAREAKTLMPSATHHIRQLGEKKERIIEALKTMELQMETLHNIRTQCCYAEEKLKRSRHSVAMLAVLAARHGEVKQAHDALMIVNTEINAMRNGTVEASDAERTERVTIAEIQQRIIDQRTVQAGQYRVSLDRIDDALKVLPPPFDQSQIQTAERQVIKARFAMQEAEQACMNAIREQQAAIAAEQRLITVQERIMEVEKRTKTVEESLGAWILFAKCMSNDGIIALSIDDAGPTLAGLANDLLLACYGPRFTVSIKTLVETVKGESREGFDIIVHDAESVESSSVAFMSGGEKVWINECLTRAIALYLAQNAGRRYQTLFSDETDGALDEERKRMYLAMKREVLSLGGYEQEYFISQTPQLTAMADSVINLDEIVINDELMESL